MSSNFIHKIWNFTSRQLICDSVIITICSSFCSPNKRNNKFLFFCCAYHINPGISHGIRALQLKPNWHCSILYHQWRGGENFPNSQNFHHYFLHCSPISVGHIVRIHFSIQIADLGHNVTFSKFLLDCIRFMYQKASLMRKTNLLPEFRNKHPIRNQLPSNEDASYGSSQ